MQDSTSGLGLMPGATGEVQPGQHLFQMPGSLDQQQQQMQMQAMMAMAAAGGAAGTPGGGGMGAGAGLGTYMAGGMPQHTMPQQSAGTDGSQAMFPPGMDPAMAQAYAQMFTQYLQTAQAYGGLDPANMGAGIGVPPAPFPQMPPASYTPPAQSTPVIAVSVDGMKFQYQLTEDDLQKVFSRYGAVKSILVEEAGTSAQITFQEYHHAQAAMSDLNGKVLNGLEGTLRLVWASSLQGGTSPALPSPYSVMPPPFGGWALPTPNGAATDACAVPGAAALAGAGVSTMPQAGVDWNSFGAAGGAQTTWPGSVAAPGSAPAAGCPPLAGDMTNMLVGGASPLLGADTAGLGPGVGGGSPPGDGALVAACEGGGGGGGSTSAHVDIKVGAAPAHVKGVRKFTCRFLIGIDNDKEFQVVRRIIGAKGTNMKRIVRQTEAKLRLRGIGSGYFEGAGQRESSEPLQLCVSCTSSDGYRTAVRLVEELLENVYNEYQHFCRENNRPEPDLHASPQLVSAGGRGGGGYGGAGDGAVALAGDSGSLSGGEGHSPSSKRDGRRRGRRSRAKKGDAGKSGAVERGDPPPKAPPIDEIEHMIDQRNEARRQCNFTEADRLRQSLHEKGVALMDEPGARGKGAEVTTWRYWRE